jgi:hypothetical protein
LTRPAPGRSRHREASHPGYQARGHTASACLEYCIGRAGRAKEARVDRAEARISGVIARFSTLAQSLYDRRDPVANPEQ